MQSSVSAPRDELEVPRIVVEGVFVDVVHVMATRDMATIRLFPDRAVKASAPLAREILPELGTRRLGITTEALSVKEDHDGGPMLSHVPIVSSCVSDANGTNPR